MYLISTDSEFFLARRLSKLDFRGPWIHSLDGVLNVLVAEMPQLRSLTVSDGGVNDAILTGLGADATMEIGRCLTYGLIFCSPEIPQTPEAVMEVVQNHLRLPALPDNYQGLSSLLSKTTFYIGLMLVSKVNLYKIRCHY